jgi:ABC-type antimicrobial peptide transport system permease subunit
MTFFTVVIRGLWRRPLRTGLTLAGISIGIAAVVALVGMSRGFEKGWQVGLKARGTDIVVANKGDRSRRSRSTPPSAIGSPAFRTSPRPATFSWR